MHGGPDDPSDNPNHEDALRTAAFDRDPVAQVVVDAAGRVTLINERARTLFGLTATDIGLPLQELEVSHKPAELLRLIEQAHAEQRTIVAKDIEWPFETSTGIRWIDIQVLPLTSGSKKPIGAKIIFNNVTSDKTLQQEIQHSKEELETAYEELQSTNEELQTTNEELESAVEELETANEELQSTNEELETMSEELQSTNAEMETVNEEMRMRGEELGEVNHFLNAILTSLRAGVVVLDSDMRIQAWNQKAEDLWGLRAAEVRGKHLMNLDIGLPVEQLRQPILACLTGGRDHSDLSFTATNRRGKTLQVNMTCSPLKEIDSNPKGVILMMNEVVG